MSGHGLGVSAIAAIAAAVTALTGAAATGSLGSGHGMAAGEFTLRGHVRGLYPGARRRLVVVVHNRGRRPLRVRSITARVRSANRACGARNLRVSPFRGRLLVRGRQSRRVAVTVWMLPESPAACQGAVFPLVFRGRATK
jgi:hypothetical protein